MSEAFLSTVHPELLICSALQLFPVFPVQGSDLLLCASPGSLGVCFKNWYLIFHLLLLWR